MAPVWNSEGPKHTRSKKKQKKTKKKKKGVRGLSVPFTFCARLETEINPFSNMADFYSIIACLLAHLTLTSLGF